MKRNIHSSNSPFRSLALLRQGCLACCLWITVQHVYVQADVVGHWRLEPGNDFFTDSVGNAHLESSVGPVESISLPSGDRGVFFPQELTGIGKNIGAAQFGPDVGELISEDGPLLDSDFTIELFANVHNFSAAQTSAHLVAQTNPANASGGAGRSQFGWTLHIRMDGFDASEPRELFWSRPKARAGNTWSQEF